LCDFAAPTYLEIYATKKTTHIFCPIRSFYVNLPLLAQKLFFVRINSRKSFWGINDNYKLKTFL